MTRRVKGSVSIFVSLPVFCGLSTGQTSKSPCPDSMKGRFPPAHRKFTPSDSPIHIRGGSVYASHLKSDWTPVVGYPLTYATEFESDPPYSVELDRVDQPQAGMWATAPAAPVPVASFPLKDNWTIKFSFRDISGRDDDHSASASVVLICSQPDCKLGKIPAVTSKVYMKGDDFGHITHISTTELHYGITKPLSPLAAHVFRIVIEDGSGAQKNYRCVFGDCTVDIGP